MIGALFLGGIIQINHVGRYFYKPGLIWGGNIAGRALPRGAKRIRAAQSYYNKLPPGMKYENW